MRRHFVALAASVIPALLWVSPAPAGGNDPDMAKQWGLAQIGAPAAWASTTGTGIRIGVVDTGVDLNHEDLAGKVVAHTSCVGSGGDPAKCAGSAQDDQGHGTHVSGIAAAAANNGVGIAGVAPDAQLVVAKALNAAGAGNVADINAGIKWVVDHGAKVVNLSLGDPNFVLTSLLGTDMKEGIEYAWSHGAVPVVASGNSNLLGLGIGSSNYGDLNALVVAAVGPDGSEASYSSPLGDAKWGIYAPGGSGDGGPENDVYSTFWKAGAQNSYTALAGTSMATPHVAGAVALLLAEGYTPQAAIDRLLSTADPVGGCSGNMCLGRMNAAAAAKPAG